MEIANKPHLVCVPFPLQGHINPMLKLAKLLHHKGFHITFVNTEFNHKRMLDARGPDVLNDLPDFCFETLPIEHPSSSSHTSLAIYLHLMRESCRKDFLPLFRNLLDKLNDKNVPPVTSIVSDFFLANAVAVGEELGIPTVLLCTISASSLESLKKFRNLMARYLTALNDASNKGQAETNVDWIPGMKDARLKDIMSIIGNKDPEELIKQSNESHIATASRASAVIIHTFEYLEKAQLVALSPTNERIYAIGPLQLLQNHIPEDPRKFLDCDMWEEQSEYIQWLNSREPKSVLYVNFGSTMFMSAEQLIELAWGIAESNPYFLWVIRPDMVRRDGAILTQEFLSETKERGLLPSKRQFAITRLLEDS